MLIRFCFGPHQGEIKNVPLAAAQAMLADGRAERVSTDDGASAHARAAAVTQAPAIDTRDPLIPSGRQRRGRR